MTPLAQYLAKQLVCAAPAIPACTLLTAYVGRDKLCIAKGAFLAFQRRPRATFQNDPDGRKTSAMYSRPAAGKSKTGSTARWWQGKLPLDGYWTMYDRELWAMGYPRCRSKPR